MRLPTEFLSPMDFESFANRIVSTMFEKKMFGFGEGKDDGIDGLDDIVHPSIVVQAKRYQSRTTPSKFKDIAKKEIDKIKKTAIEYNWNSTFEYIIVTSAELNPQTRREIRGYAGNLMSSDENIIDGIILKNLSDEDVFHKIFIDYKLKEKSLIEKLKNIQHSNIEIESKDYFLEFEFKYFVETETLYEAYEILDKHKLAILVGNPGVGKTTVCRMLGNIFSSRKDNQYLIIERDISEIQEVIELFNQNYREKKSKNLMVIFDDFLGRNSFDASDQQIKKLRNLYSLMKYSENLYIVLNSRTQILKTATGENLEFSEFLEEKADKKITIDVSKYTVIEKAYIFRKNIEKEYDKQNQDGKIIMNEKYNDIIERKNYKNIISHPNFNPRLISLIASKSIQSEGNYYQYCIDSLKNPSRIYDELFRKLSIEARYLLISLYSFENHPVQLSKLEHAFNLLKIDKSYDLKQIEEELEDSWIVIKNDETLQNEVIDFANPSIIDYLSIKKEGLKSMFNKIASETKYLSQIFKIEGVNGLYKRINNNFDFYYDKYSYSGERLNIIFRENIMSVDNKEFIKLLYKFKGEYHPRDSKFHWMCKWDDLIKELFYSSNEELGKIFLSELLYSPSNHILVTNIFEDITVDIDDIANILNESLLYFFNEGLSQNELIDFAEEESKLNLFSKIQFYRMKQIQNKIDMFEDSYTFLEVANTINSEEEIEPTVKKIVESYQDSIFNELNNSLFEADLDYSDLDFSGVESYIFDEVSYYYNSTKEDFTENYNVDKKNNEYTETVDTILNKPLLKLN